MVELVPDVDRVVASWSVILQILLVLGEDRCVLGGRKRGGGGCGWLRGRVGWELEGW
jgi:hypothetical protein